MENLYDFEVFFSNHSTNWLFSRDFDMLSNFFLDGLFDEKRFWKKWKAVSNYIEISTKKQIRHVIREEDFEISEIFHIRNHD